MKRIFITLLALLFAISLASCDDATVGNEADTPDVMEEGVFRANFGEAPSREEWDSLGYSDVISDYDAVCALVTGDIDYLEYLCSSQEGVYDSFKSVVFGDYSLYIKPVAAFDKPDVSQDYLVLDIEVLESDDDYFTVGTHSLVFDAGYSLTINKLSEYKWYTEYAGVSPCEKYIGQLGLNAPYISDFASEGRQAFACDFIVARLNTLTDNYLPVSAQQIYDYADKYLGIDGTALKLDRYLFEEDGGYVRIGKGAMNPVSTFVSEEESNGTIVATVQYWADYSKIVPSQRVKYYLELLDGEYRVKDIETVADTGYLTEYYSL